MTAKRIKLSKFCTKKQFTFSLGRFQFYQERGEEKRNTDIFYMEPTYNLFQIILNTIAELQLFRNFMVR